MTVSKQEEKGSMDSRSFLEQFGAGEFQAQLVWGEARRHTRMKHVLDMVGFEMLIKWIGKSGVIKEIGNEKIFPLLSEEQRQRFGELLG